MKEYKSNFIDDCRNENLVNEIFGSVSEFARQVEINGNEFEFKNYYIRFSPKRDIHLFYLKSN